MDLISRLRHMMADQKFFEVQKLVEVHLSNENKLERYELLLVYHETLQRQQKSALPPLIIELAEFELLKNHHENVFKLLSLLTQEQTEKYFQSICKLKIKSIESRGLINELYQMLTSLLIHQYENQIPFIPDWATEILEKYFKQDFGLKLQKLSLSLLKSDMESIETLLKDLILSCVEKSSPKGTSEKLFLITEVLRSCDDLGYLEVYRNFCLISYQGIRAKTDYKKLVEMVLIFDDFKFQTLLLNLFHQLGLKEEASQYSITVKENPEYDYVYFDKYFGDLKKYFYKEKMISPKDDQKFLSPDLKLDTKKIKEVMSVPHDFETTEEEGRFKHILKYQTFTVDQLCDLAVSFLQTDMIRAALEATNCAIKESRNDSDLLKSYYLKLTCLLQLKDYRAALDICLEALAKAVTKDDILSFLYGQAETLIRLNEIKQAKVILSKILSIDHEYRLTKERLNLLNEI